MQEGRQFKILIADSDRYARMLVSKWVTKLSNSKIMETNSGIETILTARKEIPDLVLMDVLLDEMDGYQVCKRLKEDSQTNHIPVVFLSTKGREPQERARGLGLGASGYIAKPFYGPDLLSQVRTILVSEEIKSLAQLLST